MGFVHHHLNNLICIPFLVPIMLYAERKLGVRRHDAVPQWYEVLIPIVVWSLVFEDLLPLHPSSRRLPLSRISSARAVAPF